MISSQKRGISHSLSVLALLILLLVPSVLIAQANRIELDTRQAFDQMYFLDNLGLQISRSPIRPETYIDGARYKLGPHDMLAIDIRGTFTMSMRAVIVNAQGDVNLPTIGNVSVINLTLNEAKDLIRARILEAYPASRVYISLDQPRPFHVFIHGDVPYPGKYTLPAYTRVDQALYRALFEPSASPSSQEFHYERNFLDGMHYALRNVEIRSVNRDTTYADLISYFRAGNLKSNPFINDGDVIIVRRLFDQAPRVSISGGVITPMEIEFRHGDTVQELLAMSGGFAHDAERSKLLIYRQINGRIERLDFNKDEPLNHIQLSPNDRVIIPVNREKHQAHSAWVYGESSSPGNYPIIEGETTAYDLLMMSGGVNPRALPKAARLVRRTGISDRSLPSISIHAPEILRTSDQLMQGFEYIEMETRINRNEVFVNLDNDKQLQSVLIYDGDKLFIPRDEHNIFLLGQVNNPGYYRFDSSANISQYIQKAGGFTLAAEDSRVFIIKAGSRNWLRPEETTLESGDIIFIDRVPFDDLHAQRSFAIQLAAQRNQNIQLVLTGLTTAVTLLSFYLNVLR